MTTSTCWAVSNSRKGSGIVAFVGNNGAIIERGEQRFSLGHIVSLFTPGQYELEGKAQGIDEEMDLALL